MTSNPQFEDGDAEMGRVCGLVGLRGNGNGLGWVGLLAGA